MPRSRHRLDLEVLEGRDLPANLVTVLAIQPDDTVPVLELTITGDDLDNSINIAQFGTGILIQGLGMTQLVFSDESDIDYDMIGVETSTHVIEFSADNIITPSQIVVALHGGNDSVSISIPVHPFVHTATASFVLGVGLGEGNDRLTVTETAADQLGITGDGGDDTITIANYLGFSDSNLLQVGAGYGRDTLLFHNVGATFALIDTHFGRDSIAFSGNNRFGRTTQGALIINTGNGRDHLLFRDQTLVNRTLGINMGRGDDQLEIWRAPNDTDQPTLEMRGSNDFVILMEGGNDNVQIGFADTGLGVALTSEQPLSLNTGAGDDTLYLAYCGLHSLEALLEEGDDVVANKWATDVVHFDYDSLLHGGPDADVFANGWRRVNRLTTRSFN